MPHSDRWITKLYNYKFLLVKDNLKINKHSLWCILRFSKGHIQNEVIFYMILYTVIKIPTITENLTSNIMCFFFFEMLVLVFFPFWNWFYFLLTNFRIFYICTWYNFYFLYIQCKSFEYNFFKNVAYFNLVKYCGP